MTRSKVLRAAADHDRELSLLQRDDASGDRRVDHIGAFFAHLRGEPRLTAGLTVLMSIQTLPAPRPASIPSGPFGDLFQRSELVTIEKIDIGGLRRPRAANPPISCLCRSATAPSTLCGCSR